MDATRRARIESVILEELSMVIPREVKDPRVPSLTVTSVKLNDDASIAIVYVLILGETIDHSPEKMAACLEGLKSSAGFLRRFVAKAVNIRHIPQLIFKADKGLDNSLKVHELLKQISQEKK